MVAHRAPGQEPAHGVPPDLGGWWNASDAAEYAKLIDLGKPDLTEIKGMTYCGATSGASNLTMKNVPYHEDVKKFGEALYGETRLGLRARRRSTST